VADLNAFKVQGADTVGNPLQIDGPAPGGTNSLQTPVSNSATGANAVQTATLAGTAGKFTFLSGVAFTAGGSTAGATLTCTITGLQGGTLNFVQPIPVGALVGAAPIVVSFDPPLRSSALNTNIVASQPAAGAGNAAQAVSAFGFLE
jgi:hypothetical protein